MPRHAATRPHDPRRPTGSLALHVRVPGPAAYVQGKRTPTPGSLALDVRVPGPAAYIQGKRTAHLVHLPCMHALLVPPRTFRASEPRHLVFHLPCMYAFLVPRRTFRASEPQHPGSLALHVRAPCPAAYVQGKRTGGRRHPETETPMSGRVSASCAQSRPHTSGEFARMLEQHRLRDSDDPPAQGGQPIVLLNVAIPLSRVESVMVALILDRDAQFGVRQIDAADEHVSVVHVMVQNRLGQSSVDQREARPGLRPRHRTGTRTTKRFLEKPDADSPPSAKLLLQLLKCRQGLAYHATPRTRNARREEDRVGDRGEVVRMPRQPAQLRPGRGWRGEPHSTGDRRRDLPRRQLVASHSPTSRSTMRREDGDIDPSEVEPRQREIPQDRCRDMGEELLSVHVRGELPCRLRVRRPFHLGRVD